MSIGHRTNILAAAGLALSVCLAPAALAQNGPQPAAPAAQPASQEGENQGQPRFELETPIIELGNILDTEPASGTIRFRNAGTSTLMIPSVNTTCGCTVTELPKNEFDPGESVELTVTFDPAGKTPGKHEQTVTFRTNDRANPMVAVKVRANVRPLVAIEPMQVNLGSASKHTRKETLISLTGLKSDFEAFHATLVGEGAKYFDVEILGTDSIERDGEMVSRSDILLTLRDDAPPGRAQAMAVIRTNESQRKLMTVPVIALVEGDVVTNPTRMSLGNISVGRSLEEVIEIRHGRNEPFTVKGVELRPLQPANMTAMPIEFAIEPIDSQAAEAGKPVDAYRLRLVMPSMTEAGRLRGNFVILTDVSLEEEVMLPYVGRVVDTRSGE